MFMSMRRAASCCQPLQLICVPRGARTGRAPVVVAEPVVFTMPPRFADGLPGHAVACALILTQP